MEPCSCAAVEDKTWKIDCAKVKVVQDAYDALVAENCSASEAACKASKTCPVNYRILQAHHDHCPHDTIPEAIEKNFHDFEDTCKEVGCAIVRQFEKGAPECPKVDCDDKKAQQAAVDGLVGCETTCTSADCTGSFKKVHAFHDTCDADDLITAIEKDIHTYEDACAEASECNAVPSAFDPNVCEEGHGGSGEANHDDHDDHDDHKPGSSAALTVAGHAVAAATAIWML